MIQSHPVWIVGAGPGAPDLLTLRAARLIEQAEVLVWTDSLVNPQIAALAPEGCERLRTSTLTLEEVMAVVLDRARAGKRVVRERFGVDADTCTGDRACIRISGCPSLSIKPNPDPLRTDPVTTVLDSCVGCGMCGEVSHAAVLCPSFYKAQIVSHPSAWERWWDGLRVRVVASLQRRRAQHLAQWAF